MIKFFRRIRKKLLKEGNLRRYFIYAIGEIFLVMIGILLALQVNNWNEKRKQEQLVIKLLEELNLNLQEDIKDMNSNIFLHKRSVNSANILIKAFKDNIPESDSLYLHFGRVPLVPQFLPTESAYHNLKNVGVRIIHNEILRNTIAEHYENHYVFTHKFADSEWNTSIQDYNSLYRKKFRYSELTYNGKMIPENYQDIKLDREYLNYLNNRIGILNTLIGNYETNIKRTEDLIGQINNELSN